MTDFYANDVYLKIARRMAAFNPPIVLADHIDAVNGIKPKCGPTTLEGVTFRPKNADDLLRLLHAAKNGDGKAFAEGSSFDASHWALKLSFQATTGIGFREIWRPLLNDRPLSYADFRRDKYAPVWDDQGSGRFGDSIIQQDNSSLHCAVADSVCNIHIDETGFVLEGPTGDIIVGPNMLRHGFVELFYKTTIKEKLNLPSWVVETFYPVIGSTNNGLNFGIGVQPIKTQKYQLKFTASCTVHGQNECSVTGEFTMSHNWFGGRERARPRREGQ